MDNTFGPGVRSRDARSKRSYTSPPDENGPNASATSSSSFRRSLSNCKSLHSTVSPRRWTAVAVLAASLVVYGMAALGSPRKQGAAPFVLLPAPSIIAILLASFVGKRVS